MIQITEEMYNNLLFIARSAPAQQITPDTKVDLKIAYSRDAQLAYVGGVFAGRHDLARDILDAVVKS